jgi:thymidylate synthase
MRLMTSFQESLNSNYILTEYDNALCSILNTGFSIDGDRTGVGTKCLFGINTKYDISSRVPILTKRKVAWQSIVKEVLWYISGSHNITDLENMGANIWTPWKNDEFTDKHNLPIGSGGYIYGFNLIHYGANIQEIEAANRYGTYVEDSFMSGFNQLDYVINTLRSNQKSRQACFTFWRPDTNNRAILPACHTMYHFIVSPDTDNNMTILNCHMFQIY